MSDYDEEELSPEQERRYFLILVVVLLLVVVVVALARPLIFGRIVPAIMGDGKASVAEPATPADEEAPAAEESLDGTNGTDAPAVEAVDEADGGEGETADANPSETEAEITSEVEDAASSTEDTEAGAGETAVSPTPAITTHTIRQGETLQKIAADYNVTLQALIAANPQLRNPDYIRIGDKLTIPPPQE